MEKRVVLLTDLSSYGKSSLTVMIPTLEMLGVEACPVATALLSTQSDGFLDPYRKEETDSLSEILGVWTRLGLRFSGIYTGYFSSSSQVDALLPFLDEHSGTLLFCDPVLGDGGTCYQGIDPALVGSFRDKLAPRATYVTPNPTEAKLLLGLDREPLPEDCGRLPGRHHLITGLETHGGWVVATDATTIPFEHYPASYPGTGDLFDAVLLGQLVKGVDEERAVKQAITLVALAVSRTHRDPKLGVDVRTIRKELVAL